MRNTDVVIIGAGLSGLHSAYECQKLGLDYLLLEGRDRLGGRILSDSYPAYHPSKPAVDLGPSWFWPGQTHMQALLSELQLTNQIIQQYGHGDALFEDNHSNIRRGVDGISMAGAYRLKGGIGQLIYNVTAKIPGDHYLLNAEVVEIELINEKIITTVIINQATVKIKSRFVVLAMPPRVALQSIRFTPAFSEVRSTTLNHIATWMAGHAKICLLYEQAFWRSQGLSGDVISHAGPLQEIHDASSDDGSLNALFGFVNIQAQYRQGRAAEIKAMSIAQLVRVFGESAASPIAVYLKDWAQDKFTATVLDQQIQRFHPANDIVNEVESSWNQQLIWSGSESASPHLGNNGFLEGALEASQRTSLFLAHHL
jgi:monoamine oxidase